MTKEYIVEVKNLNGEQQELIVRVDEQGVVSRVDAEGNQLHDIIIIPPATHDLLDVINNSAVAEAFIRAQYNFLEENPAGSKRAPLLALNYKNLKELPIGEIQVMDKPIIDAAIIHVNHNQDPNFPVHTYTDITCVGYVNFIDARK